jgi:hypothetical protein
MPSGRRRTQPERDEPVVFFLDRGVGRHVVAQALLDAGQSVITMFDEYPDGADQRVADDDWIRRADEHGWIAITKDYAIIRDHVDALARTNLRVFSFNSANLTGDEMATRVETHLNRILQRARKPGPFVYVIGAEGLEHRWPR